MSSNQNVALTKMFLEVKCGRVLFSCSPQYSKRVCHIPAGQKLREEIYFEEREKADRQTHIVHIGPGKKF
jgi:hypothetical protein